MRGSPGWCAARPGLLGVGDLEPAAGGALLLVQADPVEQGARMQEFGGEGEAAARSPPSRRPPIGGVAGGLPATAGHEADQHEQHGREQQRQERLHGRLRRHDDHGRRDGRGAGSGEGGVLAITSDLGDAGEAARDMEVGFDAGHGGTEFGEDVRDAGRCGAAATVHGDV